MITKRDERKNKIHVLKIEVKKAQEPGPQGQT